MTRLLAVAACFLLSAFLITPASAAPGASPEPQKQQVKAGKKAMQAKRDREKLVQETKKKAAAMKQQAQSGK